MKKMLSCLLAVMLAVGMLSVAGAEGAAAAGGIDFEDGAFSFLGMEMAKGNADASVLSVVEYNGSQALKVESQGKVPYVALNLDGLLGENLPALAKITFDVGCDLGADGKFYAVSGKVYGYTADENGEAVEASADWSVYLARKNPKTAAVELSGFAAGRGDRLVISKETDNYATKTGDKPLAFYLDNIAFLDAEGNTLPVDLSAVYVPAETKADTTNLFAVTGAVDFAGFACEGGGWGQNGLEFTQEILDALVPGSVMEIAYESEDGSMWIVLPDAACGWSRVADGGKAYINDSKTTAQITYEQIAAVCGEDKAAWGARLQCESSSAWKVFSVKVGKAVERPVLKNAVEFAGFSCEAGGWGQNGFDIPQEILDALVPGAMLEIDYESEDGSMWIVLPDAACGWSRVGNDGQSLCLDGKCYVTYEQIAAVCGEDKAAWGARLQCESSSAWKVYAVRAGSAAAMKAVHGMVEFPGFACEGGGWGQNGFDIPQEILDALVPGAVLTISYESEDGSMWIVLPDAACGWSRVGNDGQAVTNGAVCQISYEQIAAVCGEDKAAWGARLQCESSSAWKVYAVRVGQSMN